MEHSTFGERMSMNSDSGMTSYYQDLAVGCGGVGHMNMCSMLEGNMGNGVGYGELGFLEMLGVGAHIPIGCIFEEADHGEVISLQTNVMDQVNAAAGFGRHLFEKGRIAPGTPNSSSISLASNIEDVVVESEHEKGEEDGDGDEESEGQERSVKSTKLVKAKKGNYEKPRPPRFAFMTKSEVDHLEDGYRWRKYGQKAVKNSPFPRSYYRCTNSPCGVKKRVERSCSDTSIVVTTYEGQHTHPSPVTPRSISSAIYQDSALFAATQMNIHSRYQEQQQPPLYLASPISYITYSATGSLTTLSRTPSFTSFTHTHNIGNLGYTKNDQGFLRDDGLLQDLIPLLIPKEE